MADVLRGLDATLDANGGVLRLRAAFVARTFYPGLGRLGLPDGSAGDRGWYCERWIGSCVQADNEDWLEGEGMSLVALSDGSTMRLRDVLRHRGSALLGDAYAASHNDRFGLLTKVLDVGEPIPWHIHAREDDARRNWGTSGKEEAYFFLHTDNPGPLPYSHIGVHPDVTQADLLPILHDWNDDRVLDLSPAYRLNIGEGFHVPPGMPHAPGTALTLELQEESDVYNILQAISGAQSFDKSALLRGLSDEASVVDLIDWDEARRPDLYAAYHTVPAPISQTTGARESWVFHPRQTLKFSGKELRIGPGGKTANRENGTYLLFVWQGEGLIGDVPFRARHHSEDELFVGVDTASSEHVIRNTGDSDLVLYKLFGPDVNSP